jgi:hypothetical protein
MYNIGDIVNVKIYSEDLSTWYISSGIIQEIVKPRGLQSTRYNIMLDDKIELEEVNPTCMEKID